MQNKNQDNFNIVLTGFPNRGVSIEEAAQNLSKLLHIEPTKAQLLLKGRSTIIKKNVATDYIDQYRKVLTLTGAGFEIIANKSDLLSTNTFDNDETPSSKIPDLPKCPKCNYQAKNINDSLITKHNGMGECPNCGIIPKKYIKIIQKPNNINQESNNLDKKLFSSILVNLLDIPKKIVKYINIFSSYCSIILDKFNEFIRTKFESKRPYFLIVFGLFAIIITGSVPQYPC